MMRKTFFIFLIFLFLIPFIFAQVSYKDCNIYGICKPVSGVIPPTANINSSIFNLSVLNNTNKYYDISSLNFTNCAITQSIDREAKITCNSNGGGSGTSDHSALSNLNWGNAGHTIDTNFLPAVNNALDLGSSNYKWKNILFYEGLFGGTANPSSSYFVNLVSKDDQNYEGGKAIQLKSGKGKDGDGSQKHAKHGGNIFITGGKGGKEIAWKDAYPAGFGGSLFFSGGSGGDTNITNSEGISFSFAGRGGDLSFTGGYGGHLKAYYDVKETVLGDSYTQGGGDLSFSSGAGGATLGYGVEGNNLRGGSGGNTYLYSLFGGGTYIWDYQGKQPTGNTLLGADGGVFSAQGGGGGSAQSYSLETDDISNYLSAGKTGDIYFTSTDGGAAGRVDMQIWELVPAKGTAIGGAGSSIYFLASNGGKGLGTDYGEGGKGGDVWFMPGLGGSGSSIDGTDGSIIFYDANNNEAFRVWGDGSGIDFSQKINANGGLDPSYILLNKETEEAFLNRYVNEVPNSKKEGLALWWDGEKLLGLTSKDGITADLYEIKMDKIKTLTLPTSTSKESEFKRYDTETGLIKTEKKLIPKQEKSLTEGVYFDVNTGKFMFREKYVENGIIKFNPLREISKEDIEIIKKENQDRI